MFKALVVLSAWIGLPALLIAADAPPSKPPDPPKSVKPAQQPPSTPEREAAAITFVRQHHAELVDLLNQLKETKPAEYQSAIRELFQTSERLAQLREQDPQRYELELDAWKTKSRIQLLAARSTMAGDHSLEDQLRSALNEQADIRLRLMKLERDRVADRLSKLDKGIEQYQQNETTQVQRQFDALMKRITGSREQIKANRSAADGGKATSKASSSTTSATSK
jgi:hypothetical protein